MSILEHAVWFLVVSLITGLTTAAIRLRDPRRLVHEALHFFVTIAVGVTAFCVVVYVLEWIFIRPLI